jgi:putative aldouronate transport system substrate-binding protein
MVTHKRRNDEAGLTAKLQAAVPGAEIVQLPLMEKWKYTIPVSGWAALFITRECSDPERAIKMLYWAKQKDNSVSLTYGYPGVDWEYDDIGNIVTLDRYNQSAANGTVAADYKGMAFSLSADNYTTIYNGYYAAATPATRAIQDEVIKRATVSNAIDLAYPKSGTDLRYAYDDITTLTDEYFSKLCMAEDEDAFNTLYDEMLAEAENIGLSDVNAYMTQTYKDVCDLLGCE